MKKHCFWERLGPKLPRYYVQIMTVIVLCACMVTPAFAVDDMWTVANRIIVDVYNKIAGVSTVLAGLMSAVAVVGAKISNNQHKVDQSWDWLKRIWIAWAVINGIGAFLAYVRPLFDGLNTIQYSPHGKRAYSAADNKTLRESRLARPVRCMERGWSKSVRHL